LEAMRPSKIMGHLMLDLGWCECGSSGVAAVRAKNGRKTERCMVKKG
jgi:hypothetical protein